MNTHPTVSSRRWVLATLACVYLAGALPADSVGPTNLPDFPKVSTLSWPLELGGKSPAADAASRQFSYVTTEGVLVGPLPPTGERPRLEASRGERLPRWRPGETGDWCLDGTYWSVRRGQPILESSTGAEIRLPGHPILPPRCLPDASALGVITRLNEQPALLVVEPHAISVVSGLPEAITAFEWGMDRRLVYVAFANPTGVHSIAQFETKDGSARLTWEHEIGAPPVDWLSTSATSPDLVAFVTSSRVEGTDRVDSRLGFASSESVTWSQHRVGSARVDWTSAADGVVALLFPASGGSEICVVGPTGTPSRCLAREPGARTSSPAITTVDSIECALFISTSRFTGETRLLCSPLVAFVDTAPPEEIEVPSTQE